MSTKIVLTSEQSQEFLAILEIRFYKNSQLHKDLKWEPIRQKLETAPEKIWSLHEMERTGGEPDVIGFDSDSGEFLYCDCSQESPKGRRSICYDRAALDSRKEHKPANSVVDMAETLGVELLNEVQYRELQHLGSFDLKTSSWIKTPDNIRKLGGALFCDRRYNTVFTYHNGAESYYGSRGFRCLLRV